MASKPSFLFLSLTIMAALVSAHRPLMADQNPASEGSSSNMMGKTENGEKVNDMENGIHGMSGMNGMKVSPVPAYGITPIPIPGTDGQFQFQFGPFGFGANWGFGIIPGPLLSYSQPIVVSPYMPPSYSMPSPYMPPSSGGMPPPYTNVHPYQQQPGAFLPLPQYQMPSPVGGNVPYPSRQYASGTNQMPSSVPKHK
ncbi:hypothetical protein RND81_01G193800 [Saponaria officinalis]|uniref:Uncharacterized protein n=1 Tax=Saponaria officinalis TaxID=3572 RepID=A0AAW1NIF3_SAPOF